MYLPLSCCRAPSSPSHDVIFNRNSLKHLLRITIPPVFWWIIPGGFYFDVFVFPGVSCARLRVHTTTSDRWTWKMWRSLFFFCICLSICSFSAVRWSTTARRPKLPRSWACRSSPSPTTKPNGRSRCGPRLWPTYWSVRPQPFDSSIKGKKRNIDLFFRPLLNLFLYVSAV